MEELSEESREMVRRITKTTYKQLQEGGGGAQSFCQGHFPAERRAAASELYQEIRKNIGAATESTECSNPPKSLKFRFRKEDPVSAPD